MSKKSLTTLIALLAMLFLPGGLSAATGELLVLKLADQSVSKFELASSPVVTYSGNDIIVTCGEEVFQTSMANIETVKFEKDSSTGIERITTTEPRAAFTFGNASFEGMQAGATVTVYTLDGKVVAAAKADGEGRASISMSGLQRGVYIIRTPNKSFKIKK